MIYGPFSSGWRNEQERKARKARARWVMAGAWLVIAAGAGFWFEALRWAI